MVELNSNLTGIINFFYTPPEEVLEEIKLTSSDKIESSSNENLSLPLPLLTKEDIDLSLKKFEEINEFHEFRYNALFNGDEKEDFNYKLALSDSFSQHLVNKAMYNPDISNAENLTQDFIDLSIFLMKIMIC